MLKIRYIILFFVFGMIFISCDVNNTENTEFTEMIFINNSSFPIVIMCDDTLYFNPSTINLQVGNIDSWIYNNHISNTYYGNITSGKFPGRIFHYTPSDLVEYEVEYFSGSQKQDGSTYGKEYYVVTFLNKI